MTEDAQDAIRSLVERERQAWDAKDADALADLFHPEMIWSTPSADTRTRGGLLMSGLPAERWRAAWRRHFEQHELVHHERETRSVHVEDDGDGGFAIVDHDVRWREIGTGEIERWHGRSLKIFTKTRTGWKLRAHWGLEDHGAVPGEA